MMTRNLSQGNHRKRNAEYEKSCPSSQSMSDRADQDTDKNSTYAQIKTQDHNYETFDDGVIWEEDYDKLMAAYEKLQAPHASIFQQICKLSNQLTQFSTVDLLFKSSAPLWNSNHQMNILQSYCTTIGILNLNGYEMTLLNHTSGNYIATEKKGIPNSFQLFEADSLALQFFERRKEFLFELGNKCRGQLKNNALSQLSQQIIFLYHIYRKIQQKILKQIGSKNGMEIQQQEKADYAIKNLLKNLREIKVNKSKP